MSEPGDTLDLWDYRRRVEAIYRDVRRGPPGPATHERWRAQRDVLFRTHSQTPLALDVLPTWSGIDSYAYDPSWRIDAVVEACEPRRFGADHSGPGSTPLIPFGRVNFRAGATDVALSLFWLDTYGGGVFLPFRDATNGDTTYGGGRYLLDTAKGADLGHDGAGVVIDFNYAYHPSCVHDSRWSCPLAPPENTLPVAVTAGERLTA
jgi:uncharacterized protein (DUF1684 family)